MKKRTLYALILILSISLVSAVNINTNKDDYTGNETVSMTISDCTGISIVKIINPAYNVVDIKSSTNNWTTSYNTLSDSASGKYKVIATCTNGNAEVSFCVNENGCLIDNTEGSSSSSSTQTSSRGGRRRRTCISNWDCTDWSYCDNNLEEKRTCKDLNGCQSVRDEVRNCTQCQESWICSSWSECQNDFNVRTCTDEHYCNTALLKPILQKKCDEPDPGISPAQISNQPPPAYSEPYSPPLSQQPKSVIAQLWDDYKVYLIAGLSVLILLVLVITLIVHFVKARRPAYNIDELKDWVKKEREMGTSDEDIKKILAQTGWKGDEISQGLGSTTESPEIKK